MYSFYTILFACLLFALRLIALFHRNVGLIFRMRRNVFEKSQALRIQFPNHKLMIFHGASVGELMQLLPVAQAWSKEKPRQEKILFLFTFFSPSALPFTAKWEEEGLYHFLPLPLDCPKTIKRWLSILKPTLFLTASYEIWPNLFRSLRQARVPSGIISALHRENSGQFTGWYSWFFREVLRELSFVDAVDSQHQRRFQDFINSTIPVFASGDSRCDYIAQQMKMQKTKNQSEDRLLLQEQFHSWYRKIKTKRRILILASTYASCEQVIFPQLPELLVKFPQLNVIVVPHKIDRPRIDEVRQSLNQLQISFCSLHQPESGFTRVFIVDALGILLHLYRYAHLVFVGGSFHYRIHNVYEPAAHGAALAFGPKNKNSPEAQRLIQAGGAREVGSGEEFFQWVHDLMRDSQMVRSLGQKNQLEFRKNLGASEKMVRNIKSLQI